MSLKDRGLYSQMKRPQKTKVHAVSRSQRFSESWRISNLNEALICGSHNDSHVEAEMLWSGLWSDEKLLIAAAHAPSDAWQRLRRDELRHKCNSWAFDELKKENGLIPPSSRYDKLKKMLKQHGSNASSSFLAEALLYFNCGTLRRQIECWALLAHVFGAGLLWSPVGR